MLRINLRDILQRRRQSRVVSGGAGRGGRLGVAAGAGDGIEATSSRRYSGLTEPTLLRGQALRDRCVATGCRQARRRGDRLENGGHSRLLHRAVGHPQAIAVLLQGQRGGHGEFVSRIPCYSARWLGSISKSLAM